jgi:DNA processing protein
VGEIVSEQGRVALAWSMVDGIGPITFGRLIERFGSAEAAWQAPRAALLEIQRIGSDTADRIVQSRHDVAQNGQIDEELGRARSRGVRILTRGDAEWPMHFEHIPDPPIVLYVRGTLEPSDAVAIAIVGARKCSIYGSEQARRLASLLGQAGFTIVSGMAQGIDSFAHYGAVDARARSIAVLGNGLDTVYPSENASLAEQLVKHGALISELPMRTAPSRDNFPARNRLIAALSLGTIVVEASGRSGALITARLATEYNRETFAVPGRVDEPAAAGANRLIRDGQAKLITCIEDVLDELGEVGRLLSPVKEGEGEDTASQDDVRRPVIDALNERERAVYDATTRDGMLIDDLLEKVSIPAGEVLAVLTALELKGLVQRVAGQKVRRR